ncbi:MAG: M23 family metallopeptidase [Pseudomonadota bacterium]
MPHRTFAPRCAALAVAAVSALLPAPLLAQSGEFPGRVEDFPHGHYWSWGGAGHGGGPNNSQLLGYDFGMQRFDEEAGRFTPLVPGATDRDVNANNLIWNRPVYAHRGGVVRRCWAEAPDNPTGPTKHPRVAEIFPGGNMVWIDHGDGTVTLYAHFKEGTVPTEVCTNRDPFHPDPRDVNADVAPGGERTVVAGQFLGCIGHSGSSTSGPHLHIHTYQMTGGSLGPPFGPAVTLPFRSVRTKATSLTRDTPSDWSGSLDAPLPTGQAELVLPAPIAARYEPRAWIGLPFPDFLTRWQEAEADGYRLHDLEVHRTDSGLVFDGIFQPGDSPPLAHIGLDFDTFLSRWQQAEQDGFRLHDFETWTVSGDRVFSGIFRPGTFPPAALIGLEFPEFLEGWRELEAQGQRLWDLETYQQGGRRVFSGIFRPGTFAPAASVGAEFDAFVETWRALEQDGMRLHDLETWVVGGTRRYAGIFRPGAHRPAALINQSFQEFLPTWTELELLSYRMHDLEVMRTDGQVRLFGVFEGGDPLPHDC